MEKEKESKNDDDDKDEENYFEVEKEALGGDEGRAVTEMTRSRSSPWPFHCEHHHYHR